jgi:hypothetical protein
MAQQRVTKKEIQATLHDINVLLYAVEEALAAAGHEPDALTITKIGLRDLVEEVARLPIEGTIEFQAPTPATSLLTGGRPAGRDRGSDNR